ncbi:hypothetical protein CQA4T8M7_05370 [Sphaerotilus natans]|nr:hypothetical protein CQA4T8M7_05370 [Sphaerotilus natans]
MEGIVNANTTETDIETQPPWDLIALLVLAFIVLGWMALAVSYNPSRGAQHTFESLHSVVLHQYQTLPWRSFLTEMHSRHGPAFYALVSALGLSLEGMRAAGLVMHLTSTLLLLQIALRLGTNWQKAALLASAFFASPFQFGPALWGHPEALAMLLLVLGLAVPRLSRGLSRHAPVVLLPLTVTVEPSGAAAVAASCLDDWRCRRWLALLPKAGVALLALLTIHLTWREMPARGLSDALPLPHARAFLIALALLVLGLLAGDRINRRVRPAVLLHRFLLLWPGVVVLYALSPALVGGGFVFSRLDRIEGALLAVHLASPALIALVLAWSWNALRSDRLASAQILICAAALACAGQGSLYLKDVDFFFWPLLLMRLLRWGARRPALRESLLQAAILWTGIALTLATLSYPTL